jgi:membrane protein
MKKISIKKFYLMAKEMINYLIDQFTKDEVLRRSAALSYYTLFSLAPFLFLAISIAGEFYGRDAVEGKIFYQLGGLLGKDVALQIQNMISSAARTGHTIIGTIVGIIILIIGATGIFTEIQQTIDRMWEVKPKPIPGWQSYLFNRLISFSLVISVGFVMIVSLFVNAITDVLKDYVGAHFKGLNLNILQVFNYVFLLALVSSFFSIIFKLLPAARISWRDAFRSSLLTTFLFMLGKFLISFYVSKTHISSSYGAASSLIVLLVWVYYSSVIFYLGAEFAHGYALHYGDGVHLKKGSLFMNFTEKDSAEPLST